MNELKLVERDGKLLVESPAIAEELGVNHKSFMDIIYKYQDSIEASFGGIAFETRLPDKPTGNPPRVALLTEDQAIFVATLSKNTDKVVLFKSRLVKAYGTARKAAKSIMNMDHKDVRDLLKYNLRLLDEMDETNKELSKANNSISILTPLASFATDLIDIKKSSMRLQEMGPMFNLGRNTFYAILREIGVFKKFSNYPKQIYFNKGYFEKKAKGEILPDGTKAASDVAIVTTLGLEFLHGLGIFKNKNSDIYELEEFETIKKCIEDKSNDLMKFTLEDTCLDSLIKD